ncbi:helix-turn-helix domain containing protein [Roseibium sp.]|uniref:helix-turn-helix domain containing protein n=1 Tax=Roseibium sp. TaxID=1936156 RepID=UPI0032647AAE
MDIPANLRPFVEALGEKEAVKLFLSVGGSEIYLPQHSSPRSMTARTIGAENVDRLAKSLGYGYYKIPLARQWCAEVMRSQGFSNAEIARTVRADVATVRRWLPAKDSGSQPDLFQDPPA